MKALLHTLTHVLLKPATFGLCAVRSLEKAQEMALLLDYL